MADGMCSHDGFFSLMFGHSSTTNGILYKVSMVLFRNLSVQSGCWRWLRSVWAAARVTCTGSKFRRLPIVFPFHFFSKYVTVILTLSASFQKILWLYWWNTKKTLKTILLTRPLCDAQFMGQQLPWWYFRPAGKLFVIITNPSIKLVVSQCRFGRDSHCFFVLFFCFNFTVLFYCDQACWKKLKHTASYRPFWWRAQNKTQRVMETCFSKLNSIKNSNVV